MGNECCSTKREPTSLKDAKAAHDDKTNADILSGEHGAHPLGVAAGAAAGAMAGAAMGTVGGLVGVVAGAAAGGIAGGLAGRSAGEAINPTLEDAYWRENYLNRSYFIAGRSYDDYQPAYRHGWVGYSKYSAQKWNEVEPTLKSEWENSDPLLDWHEAKSATQDAWERLAMLESQRNP
jgi:hypothetical protein